MAASKKSSSTTTKFASTKHLKVRKLKAPKYRPLRLQKTIKSPKAKLPSAFRLFRSSIRHLWLHKKLFVGIVVVYLLLTIVLVKGLVGSVDIQDAKETLQGVFDNAGGEFTTSLTLFGLLLGTAGSSSSDVASVYQSVLFVVTSLVLIWALRQTYAGVKVRVKEAFYKSMYPLIPFLLVLMVIGIQLLPMLVANFLYSSVYGNGLAVTEIEKFIWALFIFSLFLLSVYLVCSSIFALYIVTLPDVTPMKALRTARELVRYRRWAIIRKVMFLPLALLLLAALIMIPAILFVAPMAEWLFFAISMFAIAITHSYIYGLYRELI